MIRYQDDTEVFFNDAQRSLPEPVYKRNCWTELFVQWSPHGSYVATLHRQGVAIWGGSSFQRLMRFSHQNVRRRLCSRRTTLFDSLELAGPFDIGLQP